MKIKKLNLLLLLFIVMSCDTETVRYCSSHIGKQPLIVDFDTTEKVKSLEDSSYVQISGIFVFEFENVAIFPSRFDALTRNFEEALWVNLTSEMVELLPEEKLEELGGQDITVEGFLFKNDGGHLGQYLGTIETVCIEVSRQNP